MTNFDFLLGEWPELAAEAAAAERLVRADPRAACFYARRALEVLVHWIYTNDSTLDAPYHEHLNALVHEPSFRETLGPTVSAKVRLIKDLGNQAVHSHRPMRQADAFTAVRELFHVGYWLARTYSRDDPPDETLQFNADLLPETSPLPPKTLNQLQALAEQPVVTPAPEDDLPRLRLEVARAKAANARRSDHHDYSEAQTRDYFIDLMLKEAGWDLDQPRDREFEVLGMPNAPAIGYADYVLWGDDGLPLAVVEAKRTKRSPKDGQQQARLYADCLERQFNRRPVIFYSNGYEHWLWDDACYPPRPVQGFLTKDELELLIQRRTERKPLADAEIDPAIVERYYQTRAIRRVCEAFSRDWSRRALLVMATGAGKTRTVIALADVLMRSNWVKRVLFLADRLALVKQAVNAFKTHLPTTPTVNLVTDKITGGRVFVSTYQTMMKQIEELDGGRRRFGPGYFDLVVIDEAHRSVFRRYRAIFEYFDALLVGLTATPKDEVARNTYRLFGLDSKDPTDAYELQQAVDDKFLVPPVSISVPLKFQREGIRYDDLPEEEKEQWDDIDWNEDGTVPKQVEAEAVNLWLFNADTVDKVLEHLMRRGQKTEGGDRLGKTIIFAKNQDHAEFIVERFDLQYPKDKGVFARVIHCNAPYAQTLIDDFGSAAKPPHIAVSVDMLDTGIDVPEIVNLVFFKLVRSKTKFQQMLGRGTRLRPDLFGPGKHKKFFYVFDYCQNLEYFSQNPETSEGAGVESLGQKLFTLRLDLIQACDQRLDDDDGPEGGMAELRRDTASLLQRQVAAMNVHNFIVRPHRRLVETYAQSEAWETLDIERYTELSQTVAGLPSQLKDEDEDAKLFDALMLRLQLALLKSEPWFMTLRDRVREIAKLLEGISNIPMIREQLTLIQEIQSDAYWEDVTAPVLETARQGLRSLVGLIEKAERKIVHTDFEDVIGEEKVIDLPGYGAEGNFERFRIKARRFLKAHDNHIAIHKLRMALPLTPTDLAELERMLLEAGVGTDADLDRAKKEGAGLGLFLRSLVGLDREAAKRAFGRFLIGRTATSSQIEFINLIIEHLTEHGVMDPGRLYESPFIDISPQGPEGVFPSADVDGLIEILNDIREYAVA